MFTICADEEALEPVSSSSVPFTTNLICAGSVVVAPDASNTVYTFFCSTVMVRLALTLLPSFTVMATSPGATAVKSETLAKEALLLTTLLPFVEIVTKGLVEPAIALIYLI